MVNEPRDGDTGAWNEGNREDGEGDRGGAGGWAGDSKGKEKLGRLEEGRERGGDITSNRLRHAPRLCPLLYMPLAQLLLADPAQYLTSRQAERRQKDREKGG